MAGEDHLELFSVKSNLPGSKGVVLLSPSWPPLAADLAAEDGAARGREACEDGAAIQSPRGALEQLQKVLSFSGARGHLPRGTAGLDAWMLACNDSSRAKARRRQEGTAAGWQQRLLAHSPALLDRNRCNHLPSSRAAAGVLFESQLCLSLGDPQPRCCADALPCAFREAS